MNQKFKTLILWALPILLVIALSYQFLSSSNVDSLKSNGTTIAPKNSAVARVSYGRFLDYINSGRVTSVDIFEGGRNAVIETIDSDLDNKVQRLRVDLPGLTPELINILKNEGISFEYESGLNRSTFDVLQSRSNLINAKINLAEAERNYLLAQYRLLKSAGLLNSDYLKLR